MTQKSADSTISAFICGLGTGSGSWARARLPRSAAELISGDTSYTDKILIRQRAEWQHGPMRNQSVQPADGDPDGPSLNSKITVHGHGSKSL